MNKFKPLEIALKECTQTALASRIGIDQSAISHHKRRGSAVFVHDDGDAYQVVALGNSRPDREFVLAEK